jgi:hypothetical protein
MSRIVSSLAQLKQNASAFLVNPLHPHLPDKEISAMAAEAGMEWRKSVFTPPVTIKASILQHLGPRSSSRDVEATVQDVPGIDPDGLGKPDGHDYCQAIARTPVSLFHRVAQTLGNRASAQGAKIVNGLRVELVDGTTMTMPRTPKNSAAFGHSGNQHGQSVLPKARVVVWTCAGSGAVLDAAIAPYRHSELTLCHALVGSMGSSALLVGDRGFSSYALLAEVKARGSHMLSLLRLDRTSGPLVEKLGPGDSIHAWKRPRSLHAAHPVDGLPEHLHIRIVERVMRRDGYRDVKLRLVTTLLDPLQWPAETLVELYISRWGIETTILWLKENHGLGMASAKSPESVHKQALSGIAAYNTVCLFKAASCHSPLRLSHKRAIERVRDTVSQMKGMHALHLPDAYDRMLKHIARTIEKARQRTPQPRAIVANPRRYSILKGTRKQWLDALAA